MGRAWKVTVSEEMYDRICRVLTDWENRPGIEGWHTECQDETTLDMYITLVDIQNLVCGGEQI